MFISLGCALPLLQELVLCANKSLNIYIFNLKELPGYCSYFVLGFFFSKYDTPKKLRNAIYLIALISFFIQFVGTSLISYKCGQASEILHRYFTPNVAIQAIAIYLFIKEFGSKVAFSTKATQLIGLLGKYSFGMYLVHDFFNGIFYRIGLFSINIPPIISIPFRTFLTFIMSFLVVCVLARIPIIKKYCM
jgi:peptidoglycan/LPS O-acetylase OafA/YrhL